MPVLTLGDVFIMFLHVTVFTVINSIHVFIYIYIYIYCTRPIYRDDFETPVACCPGKYVVRAHLFFSRFCGSLVKLGLLIGIFKTSVSVYKPTPPS